MQERIRRIGDKRKRTFFVPRHTADALVRNGTFEYAETGLSRTEPKTTSRVARERDVARKAEARAAEAKVSTQVQEPLEDKTKAQLVEHLRASGEKVDTRLSKDELLKQAKRYQRRDMRAAE